MAAIDELVVKIKQEGTEELEDSLEDLDRDSVLGEVGGGDDDGPGAGGGGVIGSLLAAVGGLGKSLLAILAVLGSIAGVLLSLEPIQKLLEGFFKVVQAFFMPLAVMLLQLLSPVLNFLIQLLPIWYKVIQELRNIKLGEWLELGAEGLLKSIFPPIGVLDIVEFVFPSVDIPWTEIINPLNWSDFLPFGNQQNTYGITGTRATRESMTMPQNPDISKRDIKQFNNQSNEELNLNLFGGLGAFVENITKDRDIDPW